MGKKTPWKNNKVTPWYHVLASFPSLWQNTWDNHPIEGKGWFGLMVSVHGQLTHCFGAHGEAVQNGTEYVVDQSCSPHGTGKKRNGKKVGSNVPFKETDIKCSPLLCWLCPKEVFQHAFQQPVIPWALWRGLVPCSVNTSCPNQPGPGFSSHQSAGQPQHLSSLQTRLGE
jgi:hypothetical protein